MQQPMTISAINSQNRHPPTIKFPSSVRNKTQTRNEVHMGVNTNWMSWIGFRSS